MEEEKDEDEEDDKEKDKDDDDHGHSDDEEQEDEAQEEEEEEEEDDEGAASHRSALCTSAGKPKDACKWRSAHSYALRSMRLAVLCRWAGAHKVSPDRACAVCDAALRFVGFGLRPRGSLYEQRRGCCIGMGRCRLVLAA